MLKTITLFKWQHDALMDLIHNKVLPQPSMHFITGPVKLGKEGEDEVVNEIYFHTFVTDRKDKRSNGFFRAVANLVNDKMASDAKDRMMFMYEDFTGTFFLVDTIDHCNSTEYDFDRTFNLILPLIQENKTTSQRRKKNESTRMA